MGQCLIFQNYFTKIVYKQCLWGLFVTERKSCCAHLLGCIFVSVPLLHAELSDDALLELLGDGPEITIVEDVKPATPTKQAGAQPSDKASGRVFYSYSYSLSWDLESNTVYRRFHFGA